MRKMSPPMVLMLILFPMHAVAGFTFDDVIQKARVLAKAPYQAPQPVAKFLREISYEAYQGIRFNPDRSLWRKTQSNFQVMFDCKFFQIGPARHGTVFV